MDYFSSDKLIEPSRGDLLISEPYLPDPNFERTVVLICEHDENGTFGYVINKKAQVKLADVMDEVDEGFQADLFIGGPVQKDSLHFVHKTKGLCSTEVEIGRDVFWAGAFEEILSKINTRSVEPEELKFFLGYSGWSPGQLLEELEQKSWIVYKGLDPKWIFSTPTEILWQEVLKKMGGKYKAIAGYPIDPRLN